MTILKDFPDLSSLKKHQFGGFKMNIKSAIKEQLKSGKSIDSCVEALPMKPMGRPLLIGKEAHQKVRELCDTCEIQDLL